MNSFAAQEWLEIAWHDLKAAQILYEAGHFTDSIGIDIQQGIEKSLKAILANQNAKIPKSHDLLLLWELTAPFELSDEEIQLLIRATEYYKEDRYPNPNYSLPSREEIYTVMGFAIDLYERIRSFLGISVQKP